MKVYLETMGCQMNALDSELAESLLVRSGLELTDDAAAADVLLYNTCSVRQHAEDKVHSRLGWACQRKAAGRRLVIGVLGCMAQRLGADLLRRHPGLDIVCGPGQLTRLGEMIQAAAGDGQARDKTGPQVALDPARSQQGPAAGLPCQEDDLDVQRDPARTHLPAQAYVRIMLGCDKFCSYCVVPHVRGPERSRSPDGILQEVRRLADGGVSAVTLLGQTVNSYRYRQGQTSVRLADLLARLNAVAGLRRVRFITSHPADFDPAILQAMADLPAACPFLHLPAQSGSDRILRAMNRHYARAEYDALVDRAREVVPALALAGDFIVGFPGETQEDHAASADLIRRSGYKNAYVFKYSPRPGTAAARLPDDVPDEVKRRRNNELLAVQEEVSLAGNRALIGRTVEVLVEGPSRRSGRQPPRPPDRAGGQGRDNGVIQLTGRTRTDHIVAFDARPALAGRYAQVTVTAASALALRGELTNDD